MSTTLEEYVIALDQEKSDNGQIGGKHYQKYPIQPHVFVRVNKVMAAEANVIKYVMRHQDKNGKEDLLKAISEINMIIKMDYPDE